jgi:ribosomal protein L37E
MKCPRCNEDMMTLCRRDSTGFMNELYYRCLTCGFIPEERSYKHREKNAAKQPRTRSLPKLRNSGWTWKALTIAMLASVVLISIMQIPVPVTVFAAQTSLDPVKQILPYIGLANFTMSQFTLNYTMGQTILRVSSDYASVTCLDTGTNVSTCLIILGKVLINYQDSQRTLSMGFASLTMTVKIRWQDLIANIDATAYMPLWTAIINGLTGQLP